MESGCVGGRGSVDVCWQKSIQPTFPKWIRSSEPGGAIFHQYLCGSKRTEDALEVHTPWVRNKIGSFSSRSMLP
jgi:hypothetical protein